LKVLITRPEPGAAATAARLQSMGFEPMMAPCLAIDPLPARLPENPAAILLTSGQAAAMLPARYHRTRCFCVGDATAAKLREAGFTSVESASGNALDLFRLVIARRVCGTHLLAVGEGHGMELARQLREHGIAVIRRKVYKTHMLAALPAAVLATLRAGGISQVLFYSAETAKAFARLRPQGTGNVTALALSPAVAEAAAGLPWRKIRVALAPNEADLLALLE
jgi:uroporphyrinogen-III synthase